MEAQSSIYCCAKPAAAATQTEGVLERLDWRECQKLDIHSLITTQKIQTRFTLQSAH
ncbi:hypothetical protein ACNKHW_03090 [Shigella flexneri]